MSIEVCSKHYNRSPGHSLPLPLSTTLYWTYSRMNLSLLTYIQPMEHTQWHQSTWSLPYSASNSWSRLTLHHNTIHVLFLQDNRSFIAFGFYTLPLFPFHLVSWSHNISNFLFFIISVSSLISHSKVIVSKFRVYTLRSTLQPCVLFRSLHFPPPLSLVFGQQ